MLSIFHYKTIHFDLRIVENVENIESKRRIESLHCLLPKENHYRHLIYLLSVFSLYALFGSVYLEWPMHSLFLFL